LWGVNHGWIQEHSKRKKWVEYGSGKGAILPVSSDARSIIGRPRAQMILHFNMHGIGNRILQKFTCKSTILSSHHREMERWIYYKKLYTLINFYKFYLQY